jgi:hypothetical protein
MNPVVQQILNNIDRLSRVLRNGEERPVGASVASSNETNNQTPTINRPTTQTQVQSQVIS